MLHSTAQRPAAQEEAVRDQRVAGGRVQRDADEAVVPEAVADRGGEAAASRAGGEALDLGFGPPDRRRVELIRALSQLRDTREMLGLGRKDPHVELQAGEELGERRRSLAQLLAFFVLAVIVGPARILRGRSLAIEEPEMAEELGQLAGVAGELNDEGLRAPRPHFGALHGVVVEQDDAVHADVQLLRQRAKVVGLRVPVDPSGDEMLPLEEHAGMPVQHPEHVVLLILAAEGQEHSGRALRERELLKDAPPRIDDDARGSVLADDPRPERLVAVEHEHLDRRRQHGAQRAHDEGSERAEKRRRIRQMTMRGASGEVVLGDGVRGRQVLGHHHLDSRHAPELRGERGFDLTNRARRLGRGQRRARGGTDANEKPCLEAPGRGFDGGRELAGDAPGFRRPPVLDAHRDDVQARKIGGGHAPRVEKLLEDLVVGGQADVDRLPQLVRPEADDLGERVGGEARGDDDRHGRLETGRTSRTRQHGKRPPGNGGNG